MAVKCKRIIEGKTYNTETAALLTGWENDYSEEGPFVGGSYLYQTRFGAFFLCTYFAGSGEDDFEKIEPFSPEQTREWLEKNQSWNVELIERLFGEMPEAGSGEAKFTLRLPDSLRDRLATLAKANSQSLNAWIVRCLESCAAPKTQTGDVPPLLGLDGSNRAGWRIK